MSWYSEFSNGVSGAFEDAWNDSAGRAGIDDSNTLYKLGESATGDVGGALAGTPAGHSSLSQLAEDLDDTDTSASVESSGEGGESESTEIDYVAMYSAAAEYAIEVAGLELEYAMLAAEEARARLGEDVTLAYTESIKAAGVINDTAIAEITALMTGLYGSDAITAIYGSSRDAYDSVVAMAEEYTANVLPGVLSGSASLIAGAQAAVSDLLKGDVPASTIASTLNAVSAAGLSDKYTNPSGFASNAAAYLGVSSTSLKELGIGFAGTVSNLITAQQGLYSGGASLAQLPISAGASLLETASPYLESLASQASLYGGLATALSGGTTISTSSLAGSMTSLFGTSMSTGYDITAANAENAFDWYWNEQNYDADMYAADLIESASDDAETSSQISAGIEILGKLWG